MSFTIKCDKCAQINNEDDIEETGNFNCGESCDCNGYKFDLTCRNCRNEIYSSSAWGNFDLEEAIEEIKNELISKPQERHQNKKAFCVYGDSIVVMCGSNDWS